MVHLGVTIHIPGPVFTRNIKIIFNGRIPLKIVTRVLMNMGSVPVTVSGIACRRTCHILVFNYIFQTLCEGYLLGSIGIILFVLIWQFYSFIVASYQFFPSFIDTMIAFLDLFVVGDFQGYTLLQHAASSISKVVLGFSTALLVGIPIGIGMGRWRYLYQLLKPLIEILRPIPPIAWIPLALYLLHAGLTTHVFIIWLGAMFPIILNTVDGVR